MAVSGGVLESRYKGTGRRLWSI